jgi:putative membrane protein
MQDGDATRRTYLANERTFLAWWRTGLTAVAVSLGIGKIAPDLADPETRWPYVAVGIGFAFLAVAVFVYGLMRERAVAEAVRRGDYAPLNTTVLVVLTGAAVLLSVATAAALTLD